MSVLQEDAQGASGSCDRSVGEPPPIGHPAEGRAGDKADLLPLRALGPARSQTEAVVDLDQAIQGCGGPGEARPAHQGERLSIPHTEELCPREPEGRAWAEAVAVDVSLDG